MYTFAVPTMLGQREYAPDWVPAVMTIGQVSEFPALLLLALCLKRFGLKTTFAIGMAAWLIRYVLFMAGVPDWLLLTAIGLHGVCHVFLIITIQLYIDSKCRSDLRASAQNLFAFITLGIAMPLGFLLAGSLDDLFTDPATGQTDYRWFFSVPAVVVFLVLVVYWKYVRLDSEYGQGCSVDSGLADRAPLADSDSLAGDPEPAG